jgi:fused signal recognition particle receptor
MNDPNFVYIVGGVVLLLFVAFFYFQKWRINREVKETPRAIETATPLRHLDKGPKQDLKPAPVKPKPVAPAAAAPANLQTALGPTKDAFWGRIKGLFSQLTTPQLEEVEEILYSSDLGPKTVQRLMASVGSQLTNRELKSLDSLRAVLLKEMQDIVYPVHAPFLGKELLNISTNKPTVWLVVGVNGAGKTTTIGKLAGWANAKGKRVLVAAGDTFRAAAASQLTVWSKRAQVEIFEKVGAPSGVAFDAVQKAANDGFDVVIVDTAGRLHTQANLMEELKKVKRVMEKALPGSPHETILVLDANNGQNALVQAKQFHEALGITGVILTKLDGTAKGGVVVGLACELGLPVRAIGIGEKMEDIRAFNAKEFVDSII